MGRCGLLAVLCAIVCGVLVASRLHCFHASDTPQRAHSRQVYLGSGDDVYVIDIGYSNGRLTTLHPKDRGSALYNWLPGYHRRLIVVNGRIMASDDLSVRPGP